MRFLYDGAALIGEFNTLGTFLKRYVHGPGIDEPIVWYEGSGTTDRRWLVPDELGSIVAVTNGWGAASSINTYDDYGIPGASNSGRFQYTGQTWLPELSLYHYKARAYAPRIGRFLQSDPILYDGAMNLYSYVANDPVNSFDPNGLCGGYVDVYAITSSDSSVVGYQFIRGHETCTMEQWGFGGYGDFGSSFGDVGYTGGLIDLRDHEASFFRPFGGHTIRDHVGKSDRQLANILRRPLLSAGGVTVLRRSLTSFSSLTSANRLVSATLARNANGVQAYLNSGATGNERFRGVFPSVTGRMAEFVGPDRTSYVRNPIAYSDVTGVTVIIRADSSMPMGFVIVSAFPARVLQ